MYETLKDCRDFGLKDQMQRAAVSIPSNIAEVCERGGKDFIRFIRIPHGSAAELRTQIYIAGKVNLISESVVTQLVTELKEIARMLTGLRRSLSREP